MIHLVSVSIRFPNCSITAMLYSFILISYMQITTRYCRIFLVFLLLNFSQLTSKLLRKMMLLYAMMWYNCGTDSHGKSVVLFCVYIKLMQCLASFLQFFLAQFKVFRCYAKMTSIFTSFSFTRKSPMFSNTNMSTLVQVTSANFPQKSKSKKSLTKTVLLFHSLISSSTSLY